jgi:hypothetical protein
LEMVKPCSSEQGFCFAAIFLARPRPRRSPFAL